MSPDPFFAPNLRAFMSRTIMSPDPFFAPIEITSGGNQLVNSRSICGAGCLGGIP